MPATGNITLTWATVVSPGASSSPRQVAAPMRPTRARSVIQAKRATDEHVAPSWRQSSMEVSQRGTELTHNNHWQVIQGD